MSKEHTRMIELKKQNMKTFIEGARVALVGGVYLAGLCGEV
jgi:hypothetical protein